MEKSWGIYGCLLGVVLFLFLVPAGLRNAHGAELPGEGIIVQPVDQGILEELFQLEIIITGLERLGYEVKPSIALTQEVGTPHLLVAQGDADFFAVHWDPLHKHFYEKVGGEKTVYRIGALVEGCTQGYLIDKKTAETYHIQSIAELKKPEIATLFDTNGDNKADLAGCHQGWGCYRVIEHQLDAYALRDTVEHNQSNYFEMIDETISRYRQGRPILYYTWNPQWVSGVLIPGKDVEWLTVPFAALPEEQTDVDTSLPDGRNLGFGINTIRIVANKTFIDANPAVKRFFERVSIPITDVSAENLKIRQGENHSGDIRRHADEWIQAHQAVFNRWISESLDAAR